MQTGHRHVTEYVLALALGLPPSTERLRRGLRAQQAEALTALLPLTEAQEAAFWAILREYECHLALLDDERLEVIRNYEAGVDALSDETASELMGRALDLECRRSAVRQHYHARIATALSPQTAARAVRIERRIQFLVDLHVAASLPVPL